MATHDTPQLGGTKGRFRRRLRIVERRGLPDITGDERFHRMLVELTQAMTASGRGADEAYHAALNRAREDEEFAVVVVKTLEALEEERYVERWAMVQLIIDLNHPVTADFLMDFVRRPIPEERSEDTVHGLSTVTEEVVLRTTAIEGLARLTQHGVDPSDALLELVADAEYVALRRAAWIALLDRGHERAIRDARHLLEERGFGWIADLRRLSVDEAEQHDPDLVNPDDRHRGGLPIPYDE